MISLMPFRNFPFTLRLDFARTSNPEGFARTGILTDSPVLMKEAKFLKGSTHKYRGFTHTWKIWKGRRPRYRFGGRVNVFYAGNVYSEAIPTLPKPNS
jgi:hypothetical protein